MKKYLTSIVPLSVALVALVSYQFMGAWTAAPASPPNNNVPAPVNIGVDSSSAQNISGSLGVDGLGVFNTLALPFTNNTTGQLSGWYTKANGGGGEFTSFLNTEGGSAPTFLSDGYALKERYNPSEGKYTTYTSNAAGTAGGAITWNNAFTVFPDGHVGSDEYCDSAGNNCFKPEDVQNVIPPTLIDHVATANDVTIDSVSGLEKWPDFIICKDGSGSSVRDQIVPLAYYSNAANQNEVRYSNESGTIIYFNSAGDYKSQIGGATNCGAPQGDILSMCLDDRCGFYGGYQLKLGRYCTVKFTTWINGQEVQTERNIFGAPTDKFSVGYVTHPDHGWVSTSYMNFTEVLHSYTWGGSTFDEGEYGALGYHSVETYNANKTALQDLDANGAGKADGRSYGLMTVDLVKLPSPPPPRIYQGDFISVDDDGDILPGTVAMYVNVLGCYNE